MTSNPTSDPTSDPQTGYAGGGFTLLEVMVALAVLMIGLVSLLALRTDSLVTAAEARNLRFAHNLASEILSEIQAGVLKVYDLRGIEQTREGYPDFRFKILVGQTEIQEEESRIAENEAMSYDATDGDQRRWERRQWLNERSIARKARDRGVMTSDLERDELEIDDTPDEDTFEDIAIYVYYTSLRTAEGEPGVYRLRAQASTLALSGLTNEQAEDKQSNLTSTPTDNPQENR